MRVLFDVYRYMSLDYSHLKFRRLSLFFVVGISFGMQFHVVRLTFFCKNISCHRNF